MTIKKRLEKLEESLKPPEDRGNILIMKNADGEVISGKEGPATKIVLISPSNYQLPKDRKGQG